ncbi:lytic transglycosylase domain-containing protein [Micromonospora sp. NPDC047793]|uniref:aggregation-promoting factor C-terminal-like domain-containing protein n=1 Tax=unclassified Micromonospora TaxID=2617518 RepID=UPI001033B34A|nr:lytic transglycosylase domain-containing protein [Verrucosispora sp. SN26_14.1]TBL35118.1 lytic transglycosylase domain-containing protein [Verrucosispora sp. SN26_14.1]
MSRPWSRFTARATAVALLSMGVAGGFYLSEDRQSQRQGPGAQVAGSVTEIDVEYRQESQRVSRQVRAAREQATETRKRARAAAEKARKAEEAARKKKAEQERRAREEAAARAASRPYDGPIPASCAEYGGNRKIGCAMMIDAGFNIDQFPCLDKLWNKESGWNHKARNPSSGAYGIPQAYPGNKMASVGADWQTNPATQITWGLGYIKGRYSNPCGAWAKSQSSGYY